MRFLLDANILIALTDIDHTSHKRATSWFAGSGGLFATCPITQGALLRFMLRAGLAVPGAKELLREVTSLPGHEFWPDSVSFLELPDTGIMGHAHVTDAYLVALARRHKGKLATLDRALAAVHATGTVLVP